MGAFNVSITVDGESKVLAKFSNLNHAIKTFGEATSKIGSYLMDFYQNQVYESEGGVYGSVWAALSSRYAKQKLRRWGATTILIASGKMKNSYQMQSGPLYIWLQNTAQSKEGKYYAKFHQTGTRKMPKRILMKLDKTREDEVKKMIVEALNVKINSL